MKEQPTYSADGKSYWNGSAWVPVPEKRRSIQNGPLGVCCLIIALTFVVALGWAAFLTIAHGGG